MPLNVDFVVDPLVAGGLVPADSIRESQILQGKVTAISPDCVFVQLEEARVGTCVAWEIDHGGHGFQVGDRVIPNEDYDPTLPLNAANQFWRYALPQEEGFFVSLVLNPNRYTVDKLIEFNLPADQFPFGKEVIANPLTNGQVSNNSLITCLLYTSPSPRDQRGSRMPSSA